MNPGSFFIITMTEKELLEVAFSAQRMSKYMNLYPTNEERAILHYKENLKLAEAFYISLSVFEVTLRNSMSRQMELATGRKDWYAIFPTTPALKSLNGDITQAIRHINNRGETVTPDKIISELTFGFWVTMLNSEYELVLWKPLRKAFPYMPKTMRQRKNVSAPCNTFRKLRNRVFHHEAICWDIEYVTKLHNDLVQMLGWINKDMPAWLATIDHFDEVRAEICKEMGWKA